MKQYYDSHFNNKRGVLLIYDNKKAQFSVTINKYSNYPQSSITISEYGYNGVDI